MIDDKYMVPCEGRRFPLFISLFGRKIVVVGGGKIASRRVSILAGFGAHIIVIAPEIVPEILRLSELERSSDMIQCIQRTFVKCDVLDAFFVLAATENPDINRQVYDACKEQDILVNVCDKKELCDFYFPAIVLDKEIVVGITGDGTNHKRVKKYAERLREKRTDETSQSRKQGK